MSLLDNISFSGRAKTESMDERMPRGVRLFCERMTRIHGPGSVAVESGGLHLYLPCPLCLENHGPGELRKRHLAINLDKVFAQGPFAYLRSLPQSQRTNIRAVLCMKHGSAGVSLAKLEKWEPLERRRLPIPLPAAPRSLSIVSADRLKHLVDDGRGNLVPGPPGEVTPLELLPADHVALRYLRARNFTDLSGIVQVSRAAWCSTPQPRADSRYRPLPHGFEQSAGGRLVFYCDINDIQQGWQARALDRESPDGLRRSWYNYRAGDYVETEWRRSVSDKWSLLGEAEGVAFDLHKYWFSPGILRNGALLGFDAAVYWNKVMGLARPFCVLVEGPLDAGRLGSPAIALFGKYCSHDQARLVAAYFKDVYVIRDRDAAGEKMLEYVERELGQKVNLRAVDLPAHTWTDEHGHAHEAKDPGDLSHDKAEALMQRLISGNL